MAIEDDRLIVEDKERVFIDEFIPVIKELMEHCSSYNIPCFFAFGTAIYDDGSMLLDGECNIESEQSFPTGQSRIDNISKVSTNDERFENFYKIFSDKYCSIIRPSMEMNVDEFEVPE